MPTRTIAHITDTHLGQKLSVRKDTTGNKMQYGYDPNEYKDNLINILKDVAQRGISEIVFGGDIGDKQSHPWFFETVNQNNLNLRLILGNHDTFEEVRAHYRNPSADNKPELYFFGEDSFNKYIYLDSSSNEISKNQMEWLSQELGTPKDLVLFLHHPVLEIDTPVDRIGAALKGRETVKQLLQKSNRKTTLFCGHYHMEDESKSGNIIQHVTPAASYQFDKQAKELSINQATFGYRIIAINDGDIQTSVVTFQNAPKGESEASGK